MIDMTIKKLSEILRGEAFGANVTFNDVIIDTSNITYGSLFVAIKGKHFDAHNFSIKAKKLGANALLVDHKVDVDLPQVVVKNTRIALGELAAWVRRQVSTRIVAVTGSSGKTSVKEMTASILSQKGSTLYTLGNLNNDIGVPMTLLRLTKEHKNAVIELGASHQGEIAWTVSLARPEAALVNNLSEAHIEGFGSLEGIARAKGEIYTGLPINGIAIMNADNNDWINWKNIIGLRKLWYFSLNKPDSDFKASNIHSTLQGTKFILQTPLGNIDILLSLLGYHNISNAIAATALSMAVGASLTKIKNGLESFKSIPGRLFPILLSKNQLLLDDSYNANIGSMMVAVQVLSEMPGYHVMVVGDIMELGEKSEIYHARIGKVVKISRIDCVFSIGSFSQIISKESGVGEHFTNKRAIVSRLKTLLKKYEVITILVKGSHSTSMEEIVYALKENKTC